MRSTPGTTWGVASATTIGSFHVREHLPNQDSVATWAAEDGSAAVAVVADGHGHPAHFRSDVGSSLAAELALEALQRAVAAGDPDPVAAGREVVEAWRAAVLEHVESHPLRSDEARRGPLVPYGSTLVATAATATRLVVVQVGDGDAVVVRASGAAEQPLPDDPDLDGVHTSSLCQPDPLASLRTAVIDLDPDDHDPVALAYVCTDGYGKARVDARTWWRAAARDLVTAAAQAGLDGVRRRLPADVAEPARVGGDDTTIAVLARA
ncbi:protein phosphatase 2C domain-containing protein [Nocardioides litoris]|uniref:protein phosphatase 2C domain-containing protein n=1 Tax=Nocardioides litoris TaxID=1926648 RepID=UPI00111D3EDC|nr:protein phosphatase 2C domain-containing protein [Nocardioides litoris]